MSGLQDRSSLPAVGISAETIQMSSISGAIMYQVNESKGSWKKWSCYRRIDKLEVFDVRATRMTYYSV